MFFNREKLEFYFDRAPRGDRDHCHFGGDAAAGAEPGAELCAGRFMRFQHQADHAHDDDVPGFLRFDLV